MPEPEKSAKPESKKPEAEKSARRQQHLSDEERKRLWREAVMKKAGQIKKIADIAIFVLLGLLLLAHLLPFVKPLKVKLYGGALTGKEEVIAQKRGYQVLMDLVRPYEGTEDEFKEADEYWAKLLPEAPSLRLGVQPRLLYARHPDDGSLLQHPSGGNMVRLRERYPATIFAYFLLLVPIGAVVVLVLYVLDYKLWMGTALPIISCVYGFASVLYLMVTTMPTHGTWNALRYSSGLAWYLLIIPMFLIGSFSLLRLVVSQRWKRYVWAGMEVPEHLKPPEPEEVEAEARHARRGRPAAGKGAASGRKKAGEKGEGVRAPAEEPAKTAGGESKASDDAGEGDRKRKDDEKGEGEKGAGSAG